MEKREVNKMRIEFESKSENEEFSRVAVAAFLTKLNPSMEEIADVKTAVSEAVTNAIIHGYEEQVHTIVLEVELEEPWITIRVIDEGVGIKNITKALEPMYTSKPQMDRSGMGFLFMEAFMDELKVESEEGKGTTVTLRKKISKSEE